MLEKDDCHISFQGSLGKILFPKSNYFDILIFTRIIKLVRKTANLLCHLSDVIANIQNYIHAIKFGTTVTLSKSNFDIREYNRGYFEVKNKAKLIQSGSKKVISSCSRSKIHPSKDGEVCLIIQDGERYNARI